MKEFYEKVKADALANLGMLVREPVSDSKESVHDALRYALKNLSYSKAASAIMIVQSWNWAVHELAACEAKAASAK